LYLSEEDDSPRSILSSYENIDDMQEELKENMLSSVSVSPGKNFEGERNPQKRNMWDFLNNK